MSLLEKATALLTGSASSRSLHKEVQVSEDLIERYDTSDRKNFVDNAAKNSEFRNNVQWDDSQVRVLEERLQVPLVVNMVHPAVEQAVAFLTANQPRWQAIGREDSDVNAGALYSDIMSWIWYVSNGNVLLKQAVDDYYVTGLGGLYLDIDERADQGAGEIFIHNFGPEHFYAQPRDQDRFTRDSDHLLIKTIESVEQLVRRHPNKRQAILSGDAAPPQPLTSTTDRQSIDNVLIGDSPAERDTEYREVIRRWSHMREKIWHTVDLLNGFEQVLNAGQHKDWLKSPAVILRPVNPDAEEQPITEEEAINFYLDLATQGGGMFHLTVDPQTGQPGVIPGPEDENSVPGSTIAIDQVTMARMVEDGFIEDDSHSEERIRYVKSAGSNLIENKVLPIDQPPVFPFMNRHNRNPYPLGDVTFIRGNQEYVNKMRSLVIAHATKTTNQTLFIPRTAGLKKKEIEAGLASAGTAVFDIDMSEGVPFQVQQPPLPNELYRNIEDAKAEISTILGIFPLQGGDPSGAPSTFRGTLAIDEFGQRRIRSKRDDLEGTLNQMGRVVAQLIPVVYTKEKTIRLFQPNHPPRQVQLNRPAYDSHNQELIQRINDTSVPVKDLIIVSGSTVASNRQARFEQLKELALEGFIPKSAAVREAEIPNVEEILAEIDEIKQLTQALEQSQEQNKEKDGKIDRLDSELQHSQRKTELEKFKGRLTEGEASTAAKARLTLGRMDDARKDMEAQVVSRTGPAGQT